jgi:hypothetical protein
VPHRPSLRGADARYLHDDKEKGESEQAPLHGFDLVTIQAGLCSSLTMRDPCRGTCRRVAKRTGEIYQRVGYAGGDDVEESLQLVLR